ncbi:MAG: hypothetical protein MJE68_15180, partial [Proteobacteria bacterium]|nr:hypothetical protein [Pseudomonadota bacterium]
GQVEAIRKRKENIFSEEKPPSFQESEEISESEDTEELSGSEPCEELSESEHFPYKIGVDSFGVTEPQRNTAMRVIKQSEEERSCRNTAGGGGAENFGEPNHKCQRTSEDLQ